MAPLMACKVLYMSDVALYTISSFIGMMAGGYYNPYEGRLYY